MTTKLATISGAAALLLTATGCSEAVPPASEGAFTVNWAPTGVNCNIGTVNDATMGLANKNEIELVKDTVAGKEVSCAVVAAGGGFNIEARLHDPQTVTTLEIVVNGLRGDATVDNPARGSVVFSSAFTNGVVYTSPADEQCRFWFEPNNQGELKQEVAAGRGWFQFGCSQILNQNNVCGLQDTSTLAIQNCDQ